MPKNGTMSTCNQFSTTEPTAAPITRPPMVITVAFPAEEQIQTNLKYSESFVSLILTGIQ